MRQFNIYSLGNGVSETFNALKLHALCNRARATERVFICRVEAALRIVVHVQRNVSVQKVCTFLVVRPLLYTRSLS